MINIFQCRVEQVRGLLECYAEGSFTRPGGPALGLDDWFMEEILLTYGRD